MSQTIQIDPALAEEHLRILWEELRDAASPPYMARVRGVILAFFKVGLLSRNLAELWVHRIQKCPGHDPCRQWCAYCGIIPPEEEQDLR